MNIFKHIAEWWRRPPVEQRILAAMSVTEWRRGFDVIKTAKVSVGAFYSRIFAMEANGWVESKWEEGPIPAARGGRRGRLYRRKIIGVHHA
jgi:hypothetical protein